MILDFGLARVFQDQPLVADQTHSRTITNAMTRPGVILGSAAYMSPEQAKGEPVDKRSDVWAFGVVLVEMLHGQPLYAGETVSETLAAVIRDDPRLDLLPPENPAAIRRLARRCLDKTPQNRLRDIGEARIATSEDQAGGGTDEPALAMATLGRALPWSIAAVLAFGLIGLGGTLWRVTRPAERLLVRLRVELGPDATARELTTTVLSPDDTRLAYVAQDRGVKDC